MTEEDRDTQEQTVAMPSEDEGGESHSWSPETPPAAQEPPPKASPLAGEAPAAASATLREPGNGAVASEAIETAAETGVGDELLQVQARIAELERQLSEEREHATDYMRQLQRAQADFANYRRRAQQEQEQRDLLATARALSTMLPALDSFERAFAALPPSLRSFSWIDGIALVHLQLREALRVQGIEPVSTEPGQPFDPQRHESVGEIESAEHPEGHIAVVLQQGYTARGLLLRPALVQLARKPQSDTSAAEATGAEAASEQEGSGQS